MIIRFRDVGDRLGRTGAHTGATGSGRRRVLGKAVARQWSFRRCYAGFD